MSSLGSQRVQDLKKKNKNKKNKTFWTLILLRILGWEKYWSKKENMILTAGINSSINSSVFKNLHMFSSCLGYM